MMSRSSKNNWAQKGNMSKQNIVKTAALLFVFCSAGMCLTEGPLYEISEPGDSLVLRGGMELADYKAPGSCLEISGSLAELLPNETYGNWKSGTLGFTGKISEGFTLLSNISYILTKQGCGVLFVAGGYKDWSEDLYTFTSFSLGSNSEITPKARLDHIFNFRLREQKTLIIPLGFSYIWYEDLKNDVVISTGLSAYIESWVLTYNFFFNYSNPGRVISYSNLVSIGSGKEGEQWTYFDIFYGENKSLPVNIETRKEATEISFYASFKNRKWLGKYYGVFVEFNYLKVVDAYQKVGISLGIFFNM